MKEQIEFSEFLEIEKKLEIKLGKITEVVKIEGSDKMLKLSVDLNEEQERTVMTNIGKGLTEKEAKSNFEGMKYYFITNLQTATIMGVESTAMIMVPTVGDELQLNNVPSGAKLL